MKRIHLKEGKYYQFPKEGMEGKYWSGQIFKVVGFTWDGKRAGVYRPRVDRPGDFGYCSSYIQARRISEKRYMVEIL